jgi:hypothetical protein
MKSSNRSVRTFLRNAAVALGLASVIASCGVTGPDEAPWGDVSAFSWPTTEGAMLKYRIEEKNALGEDSIYYRQETSESAGHYFYNGKAMVMLYNDLEGPKQCTHFLPLKDTLVTVRDRTGSLYALTAPLDKGHEWISAYSADTVPSMKAKVIERFSELKLEGTVYKNVIVVQYDPIGKHEYYWVRFFARDIGPILTLKHFVPVPGGIVDPEPQPVQRTVLVEHMNAAN